MHTRQPRPNVSSDLQTCEPQGSLERNTCGSTSLSDIVFSLFNAFGLYKRSDDSLDESVSCSAFEFEFAVDGVCRVHVAGE